MKTYRIGDIFKAHFSGDDYFLMLAQTDYFRVQAISMYNGNRWNSQIEVGDVYKITEQELEQILAEAESFEKIKKTEIINYNILV